MSAPHVQLIVDQNIEPPAPLRAALNHVQAHVSVRSFDTALADGISPTADLCVLLPAEDRPDEVLDAFLAGASDRACGAMLIPPRHVGRSATAGAAPSDAPPANVFIPPATESLDADDLADRIQALWDIRRLPRRTDDQSIPLDRSRSLTQPPAHDLDEQLRLASQIQNELLPEPITDAGPLNISTLYLPADFVSGDTYDFARLDEDRFGCSLADATGHGLPAALLAILVKNSLRGKEIYHDSYRILEPDELLTKLNRELLANNLQQCHFITALYGIFDRRTLAFRWARGGMPYPILFRPGEKPRHLHSGGGLIGVFPNQSFEMASLTLRPGDALLLYTDGLEALLLGRRPERGHDAILHTDWVRHFNIAEPQEAFDHVRRLAATRDPNDWPRDDVTALAIQVR